jgi:uncharacterized protein YyaL (SSP411 family)
MSEDARKPNRLIHETSPYLLQHAHNPVDWYAWGEAALSRARDEDKPILLSIGYAACHWCHVMEHESFENPAIAALMNEHYVCIKVDREERPDLDDIYMAATVAMTGHGGWPMTVFITPAQQPFFAGTYFPPEDRYGRPGFPTLLTRIAEVWREDRAGVEQQAGQLTRAVREQLESLASAPVSATLIAQAAEQLLQSYDPRFGGFGSAPKFPPSAQLRLLLRQHAHTREPRLLQVVQGTLDGMKNGGIYDHVGGGFARYSTDERWHVPHFEKMLYDNAQLVRVYLEAHQVTRQAEYRRVAEETLDYVIREMQAPEGGFYSATDADSEGVEGKFFVFTFDELREILAEPLLSAFAAYYDVRAEGNWEHGNNVLWTPRPAAAVATQLAIAEGELMARVSAAKAQVLAARQQRIPPLLDDKVLTGWNALMISALAEGARVLRKPVYREAAQRAADYLLSALRRPDGGLYRTARKEKAHLDAYLEDYAYLGEALIDLYECGSDERFLHTAEALCARMLTDFRDAEGGGFYQTAHGHEALIARSREAQDDALPNPSAVAAMLCARLSYHLDRPELRQVAEQTVQSFGGIMARAPRAFASMLAVVDLLAAGPVEVALLGAAGDARAEALAAALAAVYLPNRCLAHAEGDRTSDSGSRASTLPLLRDKQSAAPLAYVCRNFACEAPTSDPVALVRQLEGGLTSGPSSA